MQTQYFYHSKTTDIWLFCQTALNVSKDSQFCTYLIINRKSYTSGSTDWKVPSAPFRLPHSPRLIVELGEQALQLHKWELQQVWNMGHLEL